MKSESRFTKQARVKEHMREILEENPEGIDSGKFVDQIVSEEKVSRGMVFEIIKSFDNYLMTIERDPGDRRKAIYKPVLEQVKRDRRMYQAIHHIQNLKDPLYNEISVPKGPFTVHISVFGKGPGFDPEKEQKSLERIMRVFKAQIDSMNKEVFMPLALEKIVLFFMIERK